MLTLASMLYRRLDEADIRGVPRHRAATALRDWWPSIVSGLLQTEDYASALLRTYPGVSDEVVAVRLANRMERQRRVLMRDNPPLSWFLVDQLSL